MDRRIDFGSRDRIDVIDVHVQRALRTLRRALIVFGVTIVASLAMGALALRNSHQRLNDINRERFHNALAGCIAAAQQHRVINDFILFASDGDRGSLLYHEAIRVFPVMTDAQCLAHTKATVDR